MDPDVVLLQLRSAAREYDPNSPDAAADAQVVVDGFMALDEWLTKGGFLPKAWEPTPQPPRGIT